MDPFELHKLNVIAVIFLMTFGYPIDIYINIYSNVNDYKKLKMTRK